MLCWPAVDPNGQRRTAEPPLADISLLQTFADEPPHPSPLFERSLPDETSGAWCPGATLALGWPPFKPGRRPTACRGLNEGSERPPKFPAVTVSWKSPVPSVARGKLETSPEKCAAFLFTSKRWKHS